MPVARVRASRRRRPRCDYAEPSQRICAAKRTSVRSGAVRRVDDVRTRMRYGPYPLSRLPTTYLGTYVFAHLRAISRNLRFVLTQLASYDPEYVLLFDQVRRTRFHAIGRVEANARRRGARPAIVPHCRRRRRASGRVRTLGGDYSGVAAAVPCRCPDARRLDASRRRVTCAVLAARVQA